MNNTHQQQHITTPHDGSIVELIERELRATNKDNIEQLLHYMRDNGFYTQACHRHHHYHGGLADHAVQTLQFALCRWEADKKAGQADALDTTRESIVFAALLHDLCDVHGPYRMHGHGRKSAAVIKALGVHLTAQEFLAIRFHMSLRDKTTHPLYHDACRSYLRTLIHDADGRSAARRCGATI